MILAHHDVGHAILDALRAITITSLSIAAGMMGRYYITRPKMPVLAFVAYGCWTVALISLEIENFSNGEGFQWFQTPFALIGSLAVIIGVAPYLRFRRPADPEK